MVIPEAMSFSLPVLSTNIAGIPEMISDGVEGYLFSPNDDERAISCLQTVLLNPDIRIRMGKAGKERFNRQFDLDKMVEKYRELLFHVAPPVILIDMDGVLVDWSVFIAF